jgi:2-polyprenyl-3-methyl-5-hydroxy-6-metoxy-1,4-benzoquinol methylase
MLGNAYEWHSAAPTHAAAYISPVVVMICRRIGAKRVLDLGCGNGALCATLTSAGYEAEGCDSSSDGIKIARQAHPTIRFLELGVYDDPDVQLSGFDAVVSTEVVEHLFLPRMLPRFARKVLKPRGHLILSTPYHGYLKNLALSLAGHWDAHHSPLWDGGHIKFWSRQTLTKMLQEEGFDVVGFEGAGRFPYFWKSMILTARLC